MHFVVPQLSEVLFGAGWFALIGAIGFALFKGFRSGRGKTGGANK